MPAEAVRQESLDLTPVRTDGTRRWLRISAAALASLCLATSVVLSLRDLSGIPVYYFYTQDAPLLLAAALALFALSFVPLAPASRRRISGRMIAIATGVAASFAYAGTWLVMLRYPMSRDEQLAQFAAEHLQRGWLGWPIPSHLQPLAKALMPVWSGRWVPSGYWGSSYLPVNSALRALAGLAGDTWLAGPLLLVLGMAALWSSARRLWPETSEPAVVTLLLALTSAQLLVTAMTPYAMTAHFALNAVWLACFLRGGKAGHALAITVGLLASGLHQFHFHVMFVSGFVAWAWLSGRRAIAICYVLACLSYQLIWHFGYTETMTAMLGPMDGTTEPPLATSWIVAHVRRLREFEPFSSFARFAAWQNILLLPLATWGTVGLRRGDHAPLPIAFALQLSCMFGMAVMVYQGFGYGYRYLSNMLPCFLLLAAGGWVRLTADPERMLPRRLLPLACAFTLCVMLPIAVWQSHALLRPYAMSFRTARAAPADVVLVDGRGGGLLQDIVRIDGQIERPLLLDLAYLPRAALRSLCATRRVMLFDHRQAHALGVMGTGLGDVPSYTGQAAANRRFIATLHCDTPVPLARTGLPRTTSWM